MRKNFSEHLAKDNRIKIMLTMQLKGYPNIFALGDVAYLPREMVITQ
jgi:NADH dehydrogenase FAD-containing subunit